MIPDRAIAALRGPAFMHVGSRDGMLRPSHAFAYGAIVHDDRETITFFLGPSRSAKTLENLADNGKVAFEYGLISHEAYQIKGTLISSRPADDDDLVVQEDYRTRLYESARQGYPDAMARRFVLDVRLRPGVAVTFRAEEIYLQTPGPEAGSRIA